MACDECVPDIVVIVGEPPAGIDLSHTVVRQDDAVVIFVLVLACLSVLLRVHVRATQGLKLAEDDYAVIVGLFFTSVTVATTILAGRYGAGTHIWTVSIDNLIAVLKVEYSEPYIYAAAVTSTKIGVLLLYRRLFSKGNMDRLYSTLFLIATFLTIIYPPILWITMAVACQPLDYYWNQYIGAKGTCIDVTLFFLVLGIVNMVNDVIILLVPIPKILKLQVNNRKKLSILGIMLLGSFVCGASIARIYYLNELANAVDSTWWMGPGFLWSSVEPSIGIVSACLPTFTPLVRMGKQKAATTLKLSGSDAYAPSSAALHSQGWRRTQDDSDDVNSGAGSGSGSGGCGAKGGGVWAFAGGRALRLRPQEDDEFQLTSRVNGGEGVEGAAEMRHEGEAEGRAPRDRIMVKTKVEQSVDVDEL